MSELKLLFDTNAFYACEDVHVGRQHANADLATALKELALRHGCGLYLHPATEVDIRRTQNESLKRATLLKFRQWRQLAPIRHRSGLIERAGYREPLSSNDQVDLAMLGALDNQAVDLLITEDRRLREHAEQAGLGEQTLSLLAALDYLKQQFGQPALLPTVQGRSSYALSVEDPIFATLRDDYPEFNEWWSRVAKEHRDCLTIEGVAGNLEALAVLKMEVSGELGLGRDVLKLCTFKVAVDAEGARRGELILRAVLQYGREKKASSIYVTVFEHHVGLLRLFADFGFITTNQRTDRGELILVKRCRADLSAINVSPLEYNRLYGPGAVLVDRAFVVPIQPRWHDILYPEARLQGRLFGDEPSGNAMLKAYLCHASTRQMHPGDLLIFYRSSDIRAATAVGVVEDTHVSRDPVDIRRFVSTRTVYTDHEVAGLCEAGEVLAVRFRQDRILARPWLLPELVREGVLKAVPQSIQRIHNERGVQWLRKQLGDPR